MSTPDQQCGRCGACKWWDGANLNIERGTCQRHPPQVIGILAGHDTRWPWTAPLDWCGDYQGRDEGGRQP